MVASVVIQSAPTGADNPNEPNPQGNAPQTPPQGDNTALPSDGGNEPVKLAGKFESAADLEKAYLELQAKLGQPKDGNEPPKDPAKDPLKVPDVADVNAAKDAVKNAGLDFDTLAQKYAEKGGLEAADYDKLAKGGIPKAMVDAFIEGQKAIAEKQTSTLRSAAFEVAGSPEDYGKMVDWAATNLDAAQKAAYNEMVESGDPAKVRLAVQGLKAAYTSGGGKEPTNIEPDRPGVQGRYESLDQLMKDMGDSRYATDEAFRKAVEAKLARSNVL